eukprot:920962-Rhodomonas_salina.1
MESEREAVLQGTAATPPHPRQYGADLAIPIHTHTKQTSVPRGPRYSHNPYTPSVPCRPRCTKHSCQNMPRGTTYYVSSTTHRYHHATSLSVPLPAASVPHVTQRAVLPGMHPPPWPPPSQAALTVVRKSLRLI